MFLNLLYVFLLVFLGYILIRTVLFWVQKSSVMPSDYNILKDPWIYMFLFMTAGLAGLPFLPDFQDSIFPLDSLFLWLPAVLALVIYVVFLLEIDWLFYLMVLVSSSILVAAVPDSVNFFDGVLPFWTDRFAAVIIIFVMVGGAKILNGMSAIFGIFMLTVVFGSVLLGLIGGIPLPLAFLSAFWSGIWLGFLNLNWYPSRISLNDGACASAMFLTIWLLLCSTMELAGASCLALIAYFVAECLWVFVRRCIFNLKEADLSGNTAYMSVYRRNIDIPAVDVAVAKIGVINIIFAVFQLYSPNAYSIPLFILLVDLWLLNLLYNANEENKTINQINREFMNNVKEGLDSIKNSFKKGKD